MQLSKLGGLSVSIIFLSYRESKNSVIRVASPLSRDWHSQMTKTRQPSCSRSLITFRSRSTFRSSFLFQ